MLCFVKSQDSITLSSRKHLHASLHTHVVRRRQRNLSFGHVEKQSVLGSQRNSDFRDDLVRRVRGELEVVHQVSDAHLGLQHSKV